MKLRILLPQGIERLVDHLFHTRKPTVLSTQRRARGYPSYPPLGHGAQFRQGICKTSWTTAAWVVSDGSKKVESGVRQHKLASDRG